MLFRSSGDGSPCARPRRRPRWPIPNGARGCSPSAAEWAIAPAVSIHRIGWRRMAPMPRRLGALGRDPGEVVRVTANHRQRRQGRGIRSCAGSACARSGPTARLPSSWPGAGFPRPPRPDDRPRQSSILKRCQPGEREIALDGEAAQQMHKAFGHERVRHRAAAFRHDTGHSPCGAGGDRPSDRFSQPKGRDLGRSEERRVGKECRL